MILDKKSEKELLKHKSNFYEKNLSNRKKLNITNIFSVDNINTNDIFKVNIKKFSGFEGSYYFNGNDPLVNTAKQLIENNDINLNETYLKNYYDNFQPKTYGEVYHLKKENKLHQLESTNHFHPWINKYPTNQFRAGLFGPKDITNVEHRVIRLKNIINNIKKYGYTSSNDDIIEGYILLKDNDYRFLITGGHHRVAVLTVMHMLDKNKYNKILVKFEQKRSKVKIVKEKDVQNWPGVKSGYINEFDSLEMFNSYFC
jgi:hypothetical protein